MAGTSVRKGLNGNASPMLSSHQPPRSRRQEGLSSGTLRTARLLVQCLLSVAFAPCLVQRHGSPVCPPQLCVVVVSCTPEPQRRGLGSHASEGSRAHCPAHASDSSAPPPGASSTRGESRIDGASTRHVAGCGQQKSHPRPSTTLSLIELIDDKSAKRRKTPEIINDTVVQNIHGCAQEMASPDANSICYSHCQF